MEMDEIRTEDAMTLMVRTRVKLESMEIDYEYEVKGRDHGLKLNFVGAEDDSAPVFVPDQDGPNEEHKFQLHVPEQGRFEIGQIYVLAVHQYLPK